jgi:dTDP-glucose 4,6-dehydratase
MSKTILVTGGAGFIGSNFVEFIYNNHPDWKILVLDALTYAGSIDNLPIDVKTRNQERIEFWYGSITNAQLVDSLVCRSNYIVHLAAETHVTRSIYDNKMFFETDVLGTQTIANAVQKHGKNVEKFIHISTSEVYGTAAADTMCEEHLLNPMSPYAAAKVGADRLVFSYYATYKIPAVIIRPFNNYGPKQHLEKVIPRFITSVILDEPLHVHGDGSAQRDFVHVTDTCSAIDAVLSADNSEVIGKVFNVGTGQDHSILAIAEDIIGLWGRVRLSSLEIDQGR